MVYQSQRESCTFRSSVKSELLNLAIKRGGFIGGAGALIILLGGTLLPVEQLKLWGIPIFLAGLVLIAIGLLPYRRLSRLQVKPHVLHYDGKTITFCKQGKPLFEILDSSIQNVAYKENGHLYGLAIWLTRPIEDKVKVFEPHFNFAAFTAHSAEHFQGCDLFLPYFSEYTVREFQQIRISS